MKNILKNRLALSTVVTTLIILVVSVLLAGVVSYFAINVTSTRVQEEDLHLTKQHVWYDAATGKSEAALMIINTGGRDVVLDKLTCRGQEKAWTGIFYATTQQSISDDLKWVTDLAKDKVAVGLTLKDTKTDLTLKSGETMVIYMTSPDSISINDIGLTVALTVFTSQAMYYKETNVQAYVADSGSS
ncbi:MAG: type IV pilin [Candidatus Bathyarchaeota archaeon]|nr:type IV pilin [Candidatus Bathyarchaeota archaeon]